MKNIILLFLTITSITVVGQNHLIGVNGGICWTEVTASNFIENRDFRTGLSSGLTYDYIFKKNFSFGMGINYNQRGFTTEIIFTDEIGNPTGEKVTSEYNYDYITIPLKIGFHYGNTFIGFANIGFTPSILVDAKTITPEIDFNGTIIYGQTHNTTSKVNKFDVGGLVEIGGGYKFKDRYWVYTSFSYHHSFTTITNADYYANSDIRHNAIILSLGLKFAITKE